MSALPRLPTRTSTGPSGRYDKLSLFSVRLVECIDASTSVGIGQSRDLPTYTGGNKINQADHFF